MRKRLSELEREYVARLAMTYDPLVLLAALALRLRTSEGDPVTAVRVVAAAMGAEVPIEIVNESPDRIETTRTTTEEAGDLRIVVRVRAVPS